ncbi:lactate utilization protein C [Lysinibacillus sp. PLM2]|nr:lactate utilization protein C [Lysinibacillus sp. PLM2]
MEGTIFNRDSFLKRISSRLSKNDWTKEIEKPKWKYNPQDKTLEDKNADDLLEIFKEQCKNILTDLIVTNKLELMDSIKAIVSSYGGGPIVTWKDDRFTTYGLSQLFNENFKEENIAVYEWNHTLKDENIKFAEQANVGIMISDITLAESGTAVLLYNKDRGRSISFLPTTSIIIIPKSTLVPRMTQAVKFIMEKIKYDQSVPTCINFITGPSNSADIEGKLVVGVHGPVKVTYVVVDDI